MKQLAQSLHGYNRFQIYWTAKTAGSFPATGLRKKKPHGILVRTQLQISTSTTDWNHRTWICLDHLLTVMYRTEEKRPFWSAQTRFKLSPIYYQIN